MASVSEKWTATVEEPLGDAASLFKAAYEYLEKYPGVVLEGISVDGDYNSTMRMLILYLKRERG